ncbi:F0F1 ATP synthase subunit epsilon [Alkalilimnicola ehrlichii]|uniref:ATP synthase epsilon chain n=1 Tax=Alkalilimnicola ehrlichii TaxID=351052 RepID=A0A3E0WZD5_9GAMM|nr:F0F1 ATP synthase subunit epsilon [Alkalilimnicola ehrlichii]RFA38214.1 F0F1 ATP synthase subunit epsilon [Alkalilimnicola ehrlichii]
MAKTMHVDIVSAEEEIFSGEAEFLVARAVNGEVGIMPRHTPMLLQLQPGEVRVSLAEGEDQYFFVSGGMLEVQPHAVTILSDTAQRASDIDEAAALEAKQRAEDAIKNRTSEMEYGKAAAELAAAAAQLRALQNLKKKPAADWPVRSLDFDSEKRQLHQGRRRPR